MQLDTTSDHNASPKLSHRRIVAVCTARVFLFASFMTVAAVIPVIMSEWSIGAVAAGAIVSSFTIGYAISLFVFAWAADHFGAKRMVLASAVLAAATSLVFGFLARDWWGAMFLYGLVGLAQGGVYTPLVMVFSDEVDVARRGKAMGWLIASTSVGYALSLAAAGFGIVLGGWRAAFILCGVLPAVGAIVLAAALHTVPNRVHSRPLGTGTADELLRNRQSRLLIGGYVGHSWELLGMWAWIPAFLAAAFALQGVGVEGASVSGAYFSGVLHLFGAMAAFAMGRLSDRIGRRPVLIWVAGVACLMSFGIGWLIHTPSVVLIPLAFAYAFVCLGDSPVLTVSLAENVRAGYLGAALAWRGLAGFVAGALAPLALGVVLDAARVAGVGPAVAWGLGFGVLGLGGMMAMASALSLQERGRGAVVPDD